MGRRKARARKPESSTPLSDDALYMVLDELAQRDVLSLARICRRWRAVAVRHPSYYRFVRFDFHRGNTPHFVSVLRDASAAGLRLSVALDLKDGGSRGHDAHSPFFIEERILPAVQAALNVIKKLRIAIPDSLHAALYACLDQPPPLLEELRLEFAYPWSFYPDEEEDETEEAALVAEAHTELPLQFLGGCAPRLQAVSLSGVRLGPEAVPAFSQCKRLSFDCTVPIRRLPLNIHFPALAHLELTFWEESVPENVLPHALRLPRGLASLDIRPFYEFSDRILESIELDGIRDLRVWHEHGAFHPSPAAQLAAVPYLKPLRSCRNLDLRVFFEKTFKPDYWSRPEDELPQDVRASLADPGSGRVRTFYADEELYDARADFGDRFDMFGPFVFLAALAASIARMTIVHEFLPLLYQHFAALPALAALEVDLDVFRGPFWVTEATKESDDYCAGDRTPPPWPSGPSKRRRYPDECRPSRSRRSAGAEESDSDGAVSCDWDGYTREENRVLGILEACGMLNRWDEEPERHTVSCPALKSVLLRTAWEDRAVQTRQLAHFGRSLGLLERSPQERPQLLLRGVKLASAKYGKLHMEVFSEVVEEPVIYLKKLPEYRDHGYISPAYESYSDEDSQASN